MTGLTEGPESGVASHLDGLSREEARAALRRCCASTRWVDRMLEQRPFGEDEAAYRAAERTWWELEPEDWLEAFEAHPRIGEREGSGPPPGGEGGPGGDADPVEGSVSEWSREEQSGMEGASAEVERALAEGNRAYEERFGHVFLICATGLSAGEMLSELLRRLSNDSEEELRIAAEEQAEITRLRLGKLVED